MYQHTHYERNTRDLFYVDLGLEGESYRNRANRKQILERALAELRGAPLTTGFLTTAAIEKTKDGKDYKVIFHKSSKPQASSHDSPQDYREGESPPALAESFALIEGQVAALRAYDVADQSTNTQSSDTLTTEARDLVLYFHKRFHGTDKVHPQSKQINQAIALIARHGEELARYIVDFAYQAAPETNFKIQHFGGVLQYTSRAIEAYDAAQAKKKTREATARCTICDQNGYITYEDETRHSAVTPCPHNPEHILRVAQERGWTILNMPSSIVS